MPIPTGHERTSGLPSNFGSLASNRPRRRCPHSGADPMMIRLILSTIAAVLLAAVAHALGGRIRRPLGRCPTIPAISFWPVKKLPSRSPLKAARPGKPPITTASPSPTERSKTAEPGLANSRLAITNCGRTPGSGRRRPRRLASLPRFRRQSLRRRRSPSTWPCLGSIRRPWRKRGQPASASWRASPGSAIA